MKVFNKSIYTIHNARVARTEEGKKLNIFDLEGFSISAYIYKANGKTQLQMYGKELKYIYNMLTDENYMPTIIDNKLRYSNGVQSFAEGDRVCVFNKSTPDFEIISISQHGHLEIELKMLH